MKEAVDDIMVTLNEAASEVGMVGGMVDSITEAMGSKEKQGTSKKTKNSEKTEAGSNQTEEKRN